jgi:cytochrome c peroxidase
MKLSTSRHALTMVGLTAATFVTSLFLQVLAASEATTVAYERFGKDYTRPIGVPEPDDNRVTPARELLGRTLFFDPRLSGSNWISCASCHNPGLGWSDGLPRAIGAGMRTLDRRTPTILNLAWSDSLFWDGRADSLEQQALGPVEAAGEMNLPLDQLAAKLRGIEGYRRLFADAYPGEPIGPPTVAKAIAAFERTLVSATAPFDRWIAGDQNAMSDDAKRGFVVFNQEGRCAKCHEGWRFTDDSFHDIGISTDDPGRGALLKDIPAMASAFKTPTLRNVDQRAPYMHNGSQATLEEVVDLYDRGGVVQRASVSPEIVPLNLTATQKRDLIAFLRTLSSQDQPVVVPALPR